MHPERLRSIVPTFGGATSHVETLERILVFINDEQPTSHDQSAVGAVTIRLTLAEDSEISVPSVQIN